MYLSTFTAFVYLFGHVLLYLLRYLEPSGFLDAGHSHPYEELEAQLPSAVLEELFGITLLIGRLKDLPASIQSAFTISNHGKVCVIQMQQKCGAKEIISANDWQTLVFSQPFTKSCHHPEPFTIT